MSVIIFPGQGSQFVGMGKKLLDLPKVSRMFEIANEVLKMNLLNLCLNGPKSELDKTKNCQAAVFVTSLAAVEYLKEKNPNAVKDCYATAGFSVGEYASLVLSGAVSYSDALRIIKVRSEAMQEASEASPSGLMSVFLNKQSQLNLAMVAARKWSSEKMRLPADQVECSIANYLFSKCKVIGGNRESLDFIELNYKEFKIDRVKRLPVSGAFHTRLMQPSEAKLKEILKATDINEPLIRCYSNFDAKPYSSPDKIRKLLVKQVSHPVKWEQTLNELYYDHNLPLTDSLAPSAADEKKTPESESDQQAPPPPSSSKSETSESQPKLQTKDRIYPDIYECGPASQSGPILKAINYKAYNYYKHIEV